MIDESLLGYLPLYDPKHSQAYINAMKMGLTEGDCYNIKYHHSMIDSDNVNDSIKVKILYNELMTLRSDFSNSERRLKAEVAVLQDKNKKLEDEITSIKQALYFS